MSLQPGQPDHHLEHWTVLDVALGGGRILRFRVGSTCWKCVQRSQGNHLPSVIQESESLGVNEHGELGHAVRLVCPACFNQHSVAFYVMGMDELIPGSVIIPEVVE
jgi:hypothetical protein